MAGSGDREVTGGRGQRTTGSQTPPCRVRGVASWGRRGACSVLRGAPGSRPAVASRKPGHVTRSGNGACAGGAGQGPEVRRPPRTAWWPRVGNKCPHQRRPRRDRDAGAARGRSSLPHGASAGSVGRPGVRPRAPRRARGKRRGFSHQRWGCPFAVAAPGVHGPPALVPGPTGCPEPHWPPAYCC